MSTRCVTSIQQPWSGRSTPETETTYVSTIVLHTAAWKLKSVDGQVLYFCESLPRPQLFLIVSHLDWLEIKLCKTYLPSLNIESVWLKSKWDQINSSAHVYARVPIKSLFQIARRRKTSSIFSANGANTKLLRLLTLATLAFVSYDQTHAMSSTWPKVHLMKR